MITFNNYCIQSNNYQQMKAEDVVEADIRDNKVKEGSLVKRSRHLKEWRDRWMVLTKTHLYSFDQKGIYKHPTETIPLKDILTLKSYYKDQYEKPYTFRVEAVDANFHMYAKNSEQKWAWMTAIEKMTERLIHPNNKSDTYNLIRETIKMSSAVRDSMIKKQERRQSISMSTTDTVLKKMKLNLEHAVCDFSIQPIVSNQVRESQIFFHVGNKGMRKEQKKIIEEKIIEVPVEKIVEKIVEKEVERKVEVPVEKVVYEEKVVYVPEIKEKIIEKIIYRDKNEKSLNQGEMGDASLVKVLEQSLKSSSDYPKPICEFIVWLLTSTLQQFHEIILDFCLKSPSQRFFAETFLLMVNEETDEIKINMYLKFLIVLFENTQDYFYAADTKVLIDILLRQFEYNRSEFNQYLIMTIWKAMCGKNWWITHGHRKSEIKMFVQSAESVSISSDVQFLASQLLAQL